MISYFNSGYLIRYLVVLIISIVIWMPSFILPQLFVETRSVFSLFQFDTGWIEDYKGIFIFSSFILTLLSAIALNQILREYDLVGVNNTAALAVYILFVSSLPLFTSINFFVLINIILVIFIQNLFKLSTIEEPVSVVFNAALLIGIARMFFFPLCLLVVLIWIAIFINRHFDLRSFVISIAGMVLPYFFLFTWFYWNNTALDNGKALLHMLRFTGFLSNTEQYNLMAVILLSIIVLVTLTAFFVSISRLSEKGSFIRKNLIVGVYFLILSFGIVVLYHDNLQILVLMGLPATIVVSSAVYTLKKSSLFNISFTVLIVAVLLYQYYQLINVKAVFFG